MAGSLTLRPHSQSRYLDTSGTGAWTNVAVLNFAGSRDYGPALLYDSGKVLDVGGSDPPTATAEVIDLNAATPAWKYSGSMHYPRRQHNAVILPDGKVFIVGGSSAGGFDTSTSPVLPTEMWDPATGQFTVMASIATYRGYHSTALLLADGRVLSAGGNVGGPNAQLFSPPYLFAGARPSIASAPVSAGYGQTVFVGTPDASSISRVTLLREASVTHTNNMSQGFQSLRFTATSTGLNVTMPANANLAPPGYYMLFILNGSGVPSVGSIIQNLLRPLPRRLRNCYRPSHEHCRRSRLQAHRFLPAAPARLLEPMAAIRCRFLVEHQLLRRRSPDTRMLLRA